MTIILPLENAPTHVRDYMYAHAPNLHRFKLDSQIVEASSRAQTDEMCNTLREFDLLHTPYPAIWLTFNAKDFLRNEAWFPKAEYSSLYRTPIDDQEILTQTYDNWGSKNAPTIGRFVFFRPRRPGYPEARLDISSGETRCTLPNGQTDSIKSDEHEVLWTTELCIIAAQTLVVALSARNVVKQTFTNNRGRGVQPSYHYRGPDGIIYISNTHVRPPVLDATTHEGVSPRPHLRRGHPHTFRRGPGHSERFQKWVPPLYVNADADFIERARTYKVQA